GSWLLVGRTLAPISCLSREARAAEGRGALAQLAAPSEDVEITELVSTLNQLLERVRATASQKSRFYAAASHELRTPLQALSGHLELALARDRSPEAYREAISEAYVQTRRLITLAQDILLLSQIESARALPPTEQVDLS